MIHALGLQESFEKTPDKRGAILAAKYYVWLWFSIGMAGVSKFIAESSREFFDTILLGGAIMVVVLTTSTVLLLLIRTAESILDIRLHFNRQDNLKDL